MANINGTDSPETLDGTEDADTIRGRGGADTLNGLGGNDILDGGTGLDTMSGGLGDDIYYVDDAGDSVTEAAGAGSDTVITNASYTLGAGQEIELLRTYGSASTAAINLTGNEIANILQGNAAANVLDGKGGADLMRGYGGDDRYQIDDAGDAIVEAIGEGNDTAYTKVSYTLAAGVSVEMLRTYGSSTTALIDLTGNELTNTLAGNAAANVLDGRAGADILAGYAGNDTYHIDNAGDRIVEAIGEGSDTAYTKVSYTLAAGVSVEVLRTYGSSTTAVINLTGNELANTLAGNAAANVLDGGGGADILAGYAGNDTYHVDNAGDRVVEAANEGNDTVITSVSYSLAYGNMSVELLRTSNPASTDAIDLTGNNLDNILQGNAGANYLNGQLGADQLWGYAGDDTYRVYDVGETVHEVAGEGNDTVLVSGSYKLAPGVSVEVLRYSGNSFNIHLTGNELANTLEGSHLDNVLDGGAGADQLWGFDGYDTYYVDNPGDVVHEAPSGTIDTIIAEISWVLEPGLSVEILRTAGSSTTAAIDLTGNEIANTLVGNAAGNALAGGDGDDILWGYGGNDTLTGGTGADTYVFTTAPGAGNVDTITDFSAADDVFHIDNAVFTGLAKGALAAGAFNTGTAATETDDRIIYDSATGQLLFDVDGVGGAAAVQFATLSGAPAVTASDFWVV